MSSGQAKSQFHLQYTIVQTIKANKEKKTCIVQNSIGEYYVAKKFYANNAYALNQIKLMKTIKHPNIVTFHDIISEKGSIYLIEEFCQQGDLGYYIKRQINKKRGYFSEKTVAKWLLQLLLALQYLHSKKIFHRDIRPENIFLTSLGNLKLGSFKSSKICETENQLLNTIIKSPYYMAPQCLQNQGYDQKVDIWAFGCLIYELCTLKSIFSNKNISQQAEIILKEGIKELPSTYSKQLIEIYNKCLAKKSRQRPSARSLLANSYFLEKMKKFVTEKQQVPLRVPIKQYDIHFNILANKKKQSDVNTLKKTLKVKKLAKQRQSSKLLPRIQSSQKRSQRPSSSKALNKIKQQSITPRISRQGSKQKNREDIRQFIRQNSKEIIRHSSKQRQRSKQLLRKKSVSKNEKVIINSPIEGKKIYKQPEGSDKKVSIEKKKTQRLQTEQQMQSPKTKSLLLPPPMLPRPPQKKIQKKQTQKTMPQSIKSNQMDFSQTKKKQDLINQFSTFNQHKKQSINYDQQQVKSSLTKIFEDLNIRQDDQQQFSFQLQDENMARLTLKKGNEGKQLLQTYKTKLDQLVQEINFKYCPQMEPILQRTYQFDSNTFASVRKHNS